MKKIIISPREEGTRLDSFLFNLNPRYSRSYFGSLIKNKMVRVNGTTAKSSYRVKTGDKIGFELIAKPALGPVKAEKIPLKIIFENDDVAVIDKPAGLVVHPAAGHWQGTLINALIYHFPEITSAVYDDKNPISASRPGLVHRLDQDTSGVMIVAKNIQAMTDLAGQIQNREVDKTYLALCAGWPKNPAAKLVNYLGRSPKNRKSYTEVGPEKGRAAVSNYQTFQQFLTPKKDRISLIEFQIVTGRTHQIRTQAKMAGFPVIGDPVYFTKESQILSGRLGAKRPMLHSSKLTLRLPGQKSLNTFEAPLPNDFSQIIQKLISRR